MYLGAEQDDPLRIKYSIARREGLSSVTDLSKYNFSGTFAGTFAKRHDRGCLPCCLAYRRSQLAVVWSSA